VPDDLAEQFGPGAGHVWRSRATQDQRPIEVITSVAMATIEKATKITLGRIRLSTNDVSAGSRPT
jgi:hypothetical protein